MILKRLVNTLVTIPIPFCFFFFCAFVFYLVNQYLFELDASEIGGLVKFIKVSVGVLVAALAAFGMIGCVVLFFTLIVTGDGIIWRKVKKYNYLLNKEGEVVHIFDKSELIWRYHEMFSENELRESQVLK